MSEKIATRLIVTQRLDRFMLRLIIGSRVKEIRRRTGIFDIIKKIVKLDTWMNNVRWTRKIINWRPWTDQRCRGWKLTINAKGCLMMIQSNPTCIEIQNKNNIFLLHLIKINLSSFNIKIGERTLKLKFCYVNIQWIHTVLFLCAVVYKVYSDSFHDSHTREKNSTLPTCYTLDRCIEKSRELHGTRSLV